MSILKKEEIKNKKKSIPDDEFDEMQSLIKLESEMDRK